MASPELLDEIRVGLSRRQKALPPKFFYDQHGSELFEEITQQPEYYPTRTERALLERWAPEWVAELRPRTVLELGAGSARKTRVILEAMRRNTGGGLFVPVDISGDFLEETAEAIRNEYPEIEVKPVVADIGVRMKLPTDLPRPVLFVFLGSTLGNFQPREAVALLHRVCEATRPGDRLLLGIDLKKDPARIEAAYNDARGVTAEFNRNMLRVLNAETGANFNPDAFEHQARYHPRLHRIEMHLKAKRPQRVHVPGAGEFRFREGETLRTEISCKYDRNSVRRLLKLAGMRLARWETDAEGLYALALAAC